MDGTSEPARTAVSVTVSTGRRRPHHIRDWEVRGTRFFVYAPLSHRLYRRHDQCEAVLRATLPFDLRPQVAYDRIVESLAHVLWRDLQNLASFYLSHRR